MKNKKTIIATICIVAVLILSVTIGVVVSKNNKVTVEPETTTEVETTAEVVTEPETTEQATEETTTEVESQPETTAKAPETTKNNNTTKPAAPATTKPAAPATTKPAQPAQTQPATTAAPAPAMWEWTEADVKELVSKTRSYIKSRGYPYGDWNNTYYYAEDGTRINLSYGNPENTQYYRPDVMINELGWSKEDCKNRMLSFLYSEVDDWGGRNKTVGCFYAKDGAGWEIYVVAD